jgi:hypothetical protein
MNKIHNEKSSSLYIQNLTIYELMKLFKTELIKILIFVTVLCAFFFYTSSESKQYYKNSENSIIHK